MIYTCMNNELFLYQPSFMGFLMESKVGSSSLPTLASTVRYLSPMQQYPIQRPAISKSFVRTPLIATSPSPGQSYYHVCLFFSSLLFCDARSVDHVDVRNAVIIHIIMEAIHDHIEFNTTNTLQTKIIVFVIFCFAYGASILAITVDISLCRKLYHR